jgi:hypothetical protein
MFFQSMHHRLGGVEAILKNIASKVSRGSLGSNKNALKDFSRNMKTLGIEFAARYVHGEFDHVKLKIYNSSKFREHHDSQIARGAD